MNIEEELRNFLDKVERPRGRPRLDQAVRSIPASEIALRKRNSAIVIDHFGFGSVFWPTLERLNEIYNIGTRERVRQIIKAYYTERLPNEPFPKLKAAADILSSRSFWLESDFLTVLKHAGLIGAIDYVAGLLDYMKSQSLAADYELYMPDLENVTRGRYFEDGERIIMWSDRIAQLRGDLHEAERIPGQNGLANIASVQKNRPNADLTTLQALIRCNRHAWSTLRAGEFWYAFENRENVLVNIAAKTFSLVDNCNLAALSTILQNSLAKRASAFSYPDEELVRTWISQSDTFEVIGDRVSFRGVPEELTDIENAVVAVMRGRGALGSPEIRKALLQQGFGDAHIQKQVFYSPLVLVDKAAGRSHYTFTLVSELSDGSSQIFDWFYESIKERLRNIDNTDRDAKAIARREQSILAEWLFKDSSSECCALCGRSFGVRALVVAHKKKRAHCTETERKDPHIVFPLCTFGCDYLYELGHVTVRNGMIIAGRPVTGETEAEAVAKLVGRPLDAKWAAGNPTYFDNLPSVDGEHEARVMELV